MMVKKIVVTGASSGIGLGVCQALLEQGHQVVGIARSLNDDHHLRQYKNFFAIHRDFNQRVDYSELFNEAERTLHGVDQMVCAAGGCEHQHFGEISDDALWQQWQVNFVSPMRLCEIATERLSVEGSVLLVSSTLAQRPIATSAAYSASKAALEAMMKVASQVGFARRIRVNALALGVVDTPMVAQSRPDGLSLQARREFFEQLHPLGLGQCKEVAAAAISLLNQPWTTASVLTMDGGLTAL